MDQFQYLSLSASPREDGMSMPPLSPVLKHEHDPFAAFDWNNVSVKREAVVVAPHPQQATVPAAPPANDVPDADAPSSSLAHLFSAFSVPTAAVAGVKSFDLSSVDGTSSEGWAQLASLPLKPAQAAAVVPSVRFAPNAVSVPRFTFDMSAAPVPDSSSAPSSPVSRRGSVASTAANSRAASPTSPWSTASDENDEDDGNSSSVSAWSPSSSTASSPSSSSIRSSLSAFRQRATSVCSSSAAEDEAVDCDASPDADDTVSVASSSSGSLSPLADAAGVVAPLLPRKQPSSAPSSPVLQATAPKPVSSVRKSASLSSVAVSSTEEVKRPRKPIVGPSGLPLTPMCSPSASDAIAAATSNKASLREVGRWSVHFVPDCENPRPPKAKATPLNIVLAPPSSCSSLVPVRIRLRPQAPRSFRNVVKTARTYNVMHGVAPPADASDKDPAHFLYFSITAVDSSTKLAGPQAAHVAGRGTAVSSDRTRRQAKFKHADDKKEYQGHVQLDLSQPGDGARLEVRLFTAPASPTASVPRFHVVTGQCDHKFAHMYVSDMNTVSRV